ncbi:hypothetical protein CU098_001778 [Rhizopus stolonifer]|uniref:Rho-GAP domain-containing protein n=1 Tax=Rhizopus stolonifer TaxID=4846 RepID=A0A367IPB8_RHIST|nr:hypothetical protein CU098_001778 [Rhizopus stolonifer]
MQSSDETLVFGMQLDIAVALTKIEDDDLVPGVFKRCIDYLNLVGIHEVGIYRIPGSTLTVNKLKDEFNYGVDINFEETKPDPHVVGTLLKLYLRELPEAVIPSEYTREFRIALEEAPLNQPSSTLFTIRAARDMVAKLSTSSFCLLKPLCQHLKRVADNERENKMSVSNLSLIFIPTLNIERGLFNCLVEHYHKVFEEEKPAGPVPPPLPQKPRNLLIETQSEPKKLAHSKTMSDTGMYVNNIKHLNNSKTPPPKPTRSPNPTSNRSRQPPPLKPRSKSVSSPMRDMTLVATTSELDNETWKKRGRVEAIGKQFETLINDTQPISHHRKNAVLVNKPFANI